MQIRQMQTDDVKTIYDIGMRVDGFAVSGTSRFWTKDKLYEWVNSEDDVLLVAEEESKLVGFVMSQIHLPTKKATIENIYVDEKYRGKGIGRDLVKECLKQLKKKTCSYACAMVKDGNESTVRFFESLRFNKGYNFHWMEKEL